jgi:cell division transport system permease protein
MYFLKKAYRDIRRNILVNGLAITIIVFSLLIFSIFMLVLSNINRLTAHWEGKILVICYVQDGLATHEVENVRKNILDMKGVKSVKYVSKSDAALLFRRLFGEQKGVLEGLDLSILPASFEVHLDQQLHRAQGLEHLAKKLLQLRGITDIQYAQEWITRLSTIVHLLRWGQWILGGILFLAIAFIVSNTIKLTIYSRREEIEIMRLVGATSGHIKIPFLIEGLFQGGSGAFLALGLLFLLYQVFLFQAGSSLKAYFGPVACSFLPWSSVGGVISVGISLGVLGSYLSLARFLKA